MGRAKQARLALLCASLAACAPAGAQSAQPPPAPSAKPAPAAPPKAADAENPRRVRVATDLSAFHLDQAASARMPNQIGAVSRGDKSILALCAPQLGLASAARPLFVWRLPESSAGRVTFTLMSLDGDVLFETQATGSSLLYPEDAPALAIGQTYAWKVSGKSMNKLPDAVRFERVEQSEAAPGADSDDPLAKAQSLLRRQLWYDAVALLKSGILQYPKREDLGQQLEILYRAIAPACADGP